MPIRALTEDQIKFWLANTTITREQILEWYSDFEAYSKSNKNLDEENFIKFFEKLKCKKSKKSTADVFKLLFKGLNFNYYSTLF